MHPQPQNGSSLLEMLLALGIGSIVLTVAMPKIAIQLHNHQLKATCRRTAELLETMQVLALERHTTIEFHYLPSIALGIQDQEYRVIPYPNTVQVKAAAPRIQCYKTGVCSPSFITFTSKGSDCKVIQSLRGRVRKEGP